MVNKAGIILFISLFICANQRSLAQETVIRPYLVITAGHSILAGSFNGTDFFQTDEDIMLVPKIKPAFGVGGVMGLGSDGFAVDIGYHFARSEYTTFEDGYSGTCNTHLIRFLGVKKYFNAYAESRVSPYIDIDLTLAYHIFEKIAYPIGQPENTASGRYGGILLGAGAGVRIKLTEKLAADIRVLPEYYLGTDIRVKGRDWYEISKFGNFVLHNIIGLKYHFDAL